MVDQDAEYRSRQLEDHMATVRSVCEEWDAMHRQAMVSVGRRREIRDERLEVEARLDEALAAVGQVVMDWKEQGGDLKFVPAGGEPPMAGQVAEPREVDEGDEVDEVHRTLGVGGDTWRSAPEVNESSDDSSPREDQCRVLERPPAGAAPPLKTRSAGRRSTSSADTQTWKVIADVAPQLRKQLGSSPPSVDSYATAKGELDLLDRFTNEGALERWKLLPNEFQHRLVVTVVARLRRVQEEGPGDMRDEAKNGRGRKICGRLREVVNQRELEFVHGLKLDHEPKGDRWEDDAREGEAQLKQWIRDFLGEEPSEPEETPEEMIGELTEFIQGSWQHEELAKLVELKLEAGLRDDDPRLIKMLDEALDSEEVLEGNIFSNLRKAIRDRRRGDEEEESSSVIPEDWPYRHHFEGARVLMVGGDGRHQVAKRIREELKPGEFEWVAVERDKSTRRVEAAAKRIKRGTVDMVILVVKLLSHSDSEKIIKAVGSAPEQQPVELIYLNDSYGLGAIRRNAESSLEN